MTPWGFSPVGMYELARQEAERSDPMDYGQLTGLRRASRQGMGPVFANCSTWSPAHSTRRLGAG
jgi:hypothetical protein